MKERITPIQKIMLVLFLIIISNSVFLAQEKKLTYQQVYQFAEPRLTSSLPNILHWLDDSNYIEKSNEMINGKRSTVLKKINAESGQESIYFDYSEYEEILPEGFNLQRSETNSDDFTKYIFSNKNNLYYFDALSSEFRQLTNNPNEEKNPKFSPDNKIVAFTRENNLFAFNIEANKEIQLTFDGSETIYNGWSSWVYYEEILERSSNYSAFWWSPNSEQIAFLRFNDEPVPKFPLFNADGIHGELEFQRYPKAGDPNPIVKLGVAQIKTGEIVWMDVPDTIDSYTAWPFWSRDSKRLFYQFMNRGQDTLKIFSSDPLTGIQTKVYEETQKSWVEFFNDVYVFKNGDGFILRSDKSGWSHLYHYDLNGNLIKQITEGEWQVETIVRVDEENQNVYFEGFMSESTENHLFKTSLKGGDPVKLTRISGSHNTDVSPTGLYFIDRYSNIHNPSKLALFDGDGEFDQGAGRSKKFCNG